MFTLTDCSERMNVLNVWCNPNTFDVVCDFKTPRNNFFYPFDDFDKLSHTSHVMLSLWLVVHSERCGVP